MYGHSGTSQNESDKPQQLYATRSKSACFLQSTDAIDQSSHHYRCRAESSVLQHSGDSCYNSAKPEVKQEDAAGIWCQSPTRYAACRLKQVIAPGAARRYAPAMACSSARGGSTSVRGRVRSPHISGCWPAAGSRHAESLGSCATQPACCSLG